MATPSAPPSSGSVPAPISSSSTSAGSCEVAIHRRDVRDVPAERAQAGRDRLLVADIREDRLETRARRPGLGGDVQARLRHQRQEARGLQRDGLAHRCSGPVMSSAVAGGTSLMSTGVGVSGSPDTSSLYRDTTPLHQAADGARQAARAARPPTMSAPTAPVISASRAFACSTSSDGRDFHADRRRRRRARGTDPSAPAGSAGPLRPLRLRAPRASLLISTVASGSSTASRRSTSCRARARAARRGARPSRAARIGRSAR